MKIAPLPLLLGLVLAALSTFFIWAHLAAPVDMVDAPSGKVRCVSYTPYRDNETPFNPDYVADPARIDSDLAMLSQVTSCVRTYSVKQGLDQVVPAAEKHGMQVLLGIWIGREEKGNQQEIAQAAAKAAGEGAVTLESIAKHLYTADLPPLDLLIRTSGEVRLSNFLLWQAAYAEMYFTDVLWPDFTPAHLEEALTSFAGRERRFGGR